MSIHKMSPRYPGKALLGVKLAVILVTVAGCKKSGDALLVVGVTSKQPLADVTSVKAIISPVADGRFSPLSATFTPDGGSIAISEAYVSLGVLVPGGAGVVTVTVQAFGGGSTTSPLAEGSTNTVARAGESTPVAVTLEAVSAPQTPDGGAADVPADVAMQGKAGSSGGGGGGAAGTTGTAGKTGAAGAGGSGGAGGGTGGMGAAGAGGAGSCQGPQPMLCSGVCVPDVSGDLHHCGSCNRDCKIGRCLSERCQPIIVATDVGDMALEGASLYWLDATGVWKAGLDGSNPAQLGSLSTGRTLAVSGGDAYVGTAASANGMDATIVKFPAAGGARVTLAEGLSPLWEDLAVRGGFVYWATANDLAKTATLWKTSTTAGGTPIALATVPGGVAKIVVDATSVYWTDQVGGNVSKVGLAGGTVTVLATGQTGASGLAVDATSVYWGNSRPSGSVAKTSLAGGAEPTVLSGPWPFPDDVVLDGTNLFVGTGGVKMVKVPVGGGSSLEADIWFGGHHDLVVDATSLYWISSGDLVKAAKF